MLYVADHGESLGEHGIYLHAAPYMIAPKEQTHVPSILWVGQHFDYQLSQVRPYENYPLSHDDVFCTLLTAYELKSETCHAEFGWLAQNRELQEEQRQHLHPLKTTPH
jgi:lipid A ethanolaminephosphotransferase